MRSFQLSCIWVALVATAACSVINKPDDLVEGTTTGGGGDAGSTNGGSGGTSGSGGSSAGGSGGSTSMTTDSGGSTSTTDSGGSDAGGSTSDSGGSSAGGAAGETSAGGTGGDTTSTGGTGGGTTMGTGGTGGGTTMGTGGTGGSPPAPMTGLVGVSARIADGSGEQVLAMLGEDGEQLDREPLSVAALAHDGAPERDVWFVFIAEDIFPLDRGRPADLEVRRFDDESHSWDVISKVTALPPPRAGQVVVLNGYVAYLSYQNSNESESLTILDTRNLEDVQQIETLPSVATNSQNMLGLLGVRGSSTDPLASGGTLNLMLEDCSVSGCPLAIRPVFVGSTVTTGSLVSIGAYQGTPAFAQALTERHSFIAMHSTADSSVRLYDVDPFDIDQFEDTPLPSVSTSLNGLALFECENAVVISEGAENRLRGVSLQGGTSIPFDLGREAQGLWFEPFTQVLIAPYNSDVDLADPTEDIPGAIDAVSVTGQGVSAPLIELLAEDEWSPPDDLRVLTAAVRIPPTFSCD